MRRCHDGGGCRSDGVWSQWRRLEAGFTGGGHSGIVGPSEQKAFIIDYYKMHYPKDKEKDLILLRYGERRPTKFKYRKWTLAAIAKCTSRSISYVRRICKDYQREFESKKDSKVIMTRKTLKLQLASKVHAKRPTPEMISYLIDPEVVRSWSHLTLVERKQMLHRRFPERHVSIYYLRQVYRRHGISKKKIRKTKLVTAEHRQRIREECLEARQQLAEAKAEGYDIIYADEFVTTVSTIPTHAYSLKLQPLLIDRRDFQQKCVATITSMSSQNGIELVQNFESSFDRSKFISWLKALRRRHPFRKMCLFLDRLSVHRSQVVKDEMQRLQFRYIYNGSYR